MEKFYKQWCKRIAQSRSSEELIIHFREHVCEHYERHNRGEKINLEIWLVGVLNFMHIFKEKFSHLTTDDMLFKLCTYHKNHEGGVEPSFDVDIFLDSYDGAIKKSHKINE